MVKHNPYQAYQQQAVMTMTPGDMLTALYDGLLKRLNLAKAGFASRDYAAVNRSLQKAQLILHHLQGSLNFQYEISNSLNALYEYFDHVTVQANVKKEPGGLDEVIQMIGDLRETYIQAAKQTRTAE